MYRDRKNSVTLRWLMIVCLAAVLLFFVSHFSKKANAQIDDESIVSIREAIRHAAVQCYVVEGAYPVDLDYLKENYGLNINEKSYYVVYSAFAENQMPDIRVVRK